MAAVVSHHEDSCEEGTLYCPVGNHQDGPQDERVCEFAEVVEDGKTDRDLDQVLHDIVHRGGDFWLEANGWNGPLDFYDRWQVGRKGSCHVTAFQLVPVG